MLMTRPQRRLIMPRAAYLVIRNAPFRFVSITESESALVMRNKRLSLVNPALLTRTSILPKSVSTASASASTWAAMPTSQPYPLAPSPSSAATCCDLAASREHSATFAPAPARTRQISCPIPRVPPVTNAILPVRSSFTPSRGLHESRHLVRRPQAHHVRPRNDSLQEAGQDRPGPDFDEAHLRPVAREPRGVLHALHPTDWGRELIGEEPPRPARVLHRLGRGVGDHGEHGVLERRLLQRHLEMILCGRHQRRVKRAAHLERYDPLRAAFLARLARARHRIRVARDHRLVGPVEIGGYRDAALLRRFVTRGLDLRGREPQHRGHHPRALLPGLVHQLAAAAHELGRVGRLERLGGDVGGVLAQRVSCRTDAAGGGSPQGGEHGGAVRQNRRLRVVRRRELVLGAIKHQLGQRDAEGVVNRLEHIPRGGKPLREILAHPDFLRAPARAEPDRSYHFTTMLAHVKPAPKATNMTVIPGWSRPVFTASSSAMAIDAADVVPNRSTLT